MFTRRSIIQKTVQVGKFTLLSRLFGLTREILQVRYLGASALSDAFITAWKVPNFFRKIFAEGALSAAFVPTIVQKVRAEGHKAVGSMMMLGFLVFEGMVLLLCALIMGWAYKFVAIIAPGFSHEQIAYSALYLRILMPFLFFISTSALLAGALQAVGHFFIPALGPVLFNTMFIAGLIVCMAFQLPVTALCWFILAGGFVQLIAHIMAYLNLQFTFQWLSKKDIAQFLPILSKFFLCLLSMSVMELGLFIDTSFGSYLSKGSVSLIYYANRWMGIPLGVFGIAFSTILLPHFSRVSAYAPRRLGFYLLEATKLVWWVMIPVSVAMVLLAQNIFSTIYLSQKFTMVHVHEASTLLIIFLCGLFFFAINKILLNVYYALHHTLIPGLIAAFAMICNTVLNWVLLDILGANGLVLATTIAGVLQTILLFAVLHYHFQLPIYMKTLARFMGRCLVQQVVIAIPFLLVYQLLYYAISQMPPFVVSIFINHIGFWLWVGPLLGAYMAAMYFTNRLFRIRLLFLE